MVEFTGRPPRLPPELVAAKKSVRTWGSIVPLGAVSLIVVGAAITVIVRFCAAVTILNFSDLRLVTANTIGHSKLRRELLQMPTRSQQRAWVRANWFRDGIRQRLLR
jgi:hypothetical protein